MNNFFKLYKRFETMGFWIIGIALLSGFILSILSWLNLCVEHCSANQDYRLFGLPFAPVGVAFFSVLLFLHIFSRWYPILTQIVGWMIASAIGAEVMFIAVQKYQIGQWCPLCLSIALCLVIAGLIYATSYIQALLITIQQSNRGEIMHKIKKGFSSLSFFVIGFVLAFIGVTKPDLALAEANSIKDRIVFGNKESLVEVYFVTDWFCPSCRKIEPQIEALLPKIQAKVAFYFIDYPLHTKSMNFCAYNLTFLLNNKAQYLDARHMLTALTKKTDEPKDHDVLEASNKAGIRFKDVTFVEIKSGMDYFDSIVQKYDLKYTPTIIITNTKTNKMEKFEGTDEISKEKVIKAIEKLSQVS